MSRARVVLVQGMSALEDLLRDSGQYKVHEADEEACTREIGSMGECGAWVSVEVEVGEMGPILRPPSLSLALVLLV